MGYLIFRNVSTKSLPHVEVARMPSHKKASVRNTEYYVKGRDGALHIKEGLANFDITVTLVMLNADANTRQLINAWADGTGKLISSDDLTRAYMATVNDEIEWLRVQANGGFYDMANIIFNCQPFMVESVDSVAEFTESGSLLNPGTEESFPLIKVEGVGNVDFLINGSPISIDGMTAENPVFIDCETGYVYTPSGAATMRGEIPSLILGVNNIQFGMNVAKITITPHWRWV